MGDKTKIEWTDRTWNPLRGCSKVSEGCRNCYAMGFAARFSGPGLPYEGLAMMDAAGKPQWTNAIRLLPDKLKEPLQWQKPQKVFVNSMSDVFHPGVPDVFIDRMFAVMALCPQHTFQVLTKRPETMRGYLNDSRVQLRIAHAAFHILNELLAERPKLKHFWLEEHLAHGIPEPQAWRYKHAMFGTLPQWPLPNVWVGVSVENQRAAEERIPRLLQTPAAVRFLSVEPLLGPVNLLDVGVLHWDVLNGWIPNVDARGTVREGSYGKNTEWINWVIVGGESGPNARPMNTDWARGIRENCLEAKVPFFFKQYGEYQVITLDNEEEAPAGYKQISEWRSPLGTELQFADFGGRNKKRSMSRELDGQEWNEFPGALDEPEEEEFDDQADDED